MRLSGAAVLLFTLGLLPGAELRFAIRSDPKTFNPILVADEAAETVRYLTGGVLVRLNRATQRLEPELASAWRVSERGRRIDFTLRSGVRFSDGTPFGCEDVAYTIRELMKPEVHSSTGDAFRSGPGNVETRCTGAGSVMARFPAPVAALDSLFDQVAMMSSRSAQHERAVLGPFVVAGYRPGVEILLRRNPHYWKHGRDGGSLPRLEAVRLTILQNRELEMLRFRRGELDVINKMAPELFDQLASGGPKTAVDGGPTLDWEVVFFNQVAGAPVPEYRKAWFRSAAFRRAISEAINRADLCRIAWRGRAAPAAGPVSPSNRFWRNAALKPPAYSPQDALRRLAADGFHRVNGALVDRAGHRVEFSMITNAGNKAHERMLALIQQDLSKVGVKLNVTALDFASLVDRISRSYDYESCLMAFANIDLDPNGQMNIWLSSASNHQWNPEEKSPATQWEADIDRLMKAQAATLDVQKRKAAFDRVQEIVAEQAPMLFLVHPDALSAISPAVKNAALAVLRPQTYWNIEYLSK